MRTTLHEFAAGVPKSSRRAATRTWLRRQWDAFDQAWRGLSRTEVLWTFAVALVFMVAQAYSLNTARGRSWPFPVRAYEWFDIPFSLIFILAFRFAEQPREPSIRLWQRYAFAIPLAVVLHHFAFRFLIPATHEKHEIAGMAAFMFGNLKVLLICCIGAVVYSSLARSRRAQVAFEAAAVERAGSRRRVSAARLASQQARLEPTFLFSSLELIQALHERDRDAAEAALQYLIDYLRGALPKLGEEGSTLGREVELARLYLEIVRVRMGSRLVIDIEIPPEARVASFPPMIVVPLVEHALRQGLEPLSHGGKLEIRAVKKSDRLHVTVSHDGVAFDPAGAWLAPMRERLQGHYGDAARLTVTASSRGGTATVDVPFESSLGDVASVATIAPIGSKT